MGIDGSWIRGIMRDTRGSTQDSPEKALAARPDARSINSTRTYPNMIRKPPCRILEIRPVYLDMEAMKQGYSVGQKGM